MLLTNQWLDKLVAMCADFVEHDMLPGSYTANRTLQGPKHLRMPTDDDDDDNNEGPVDEDILGHVTLARNRGMSCIKSHSTSF